MSLLFVKILAALVILATSLAAGLKPLRVAYDKPGHRLFELGEALGGGVFLGIGLFHMLPDAERSLHLAFPDVEYPFANLLCAIGFILLLFLEKIVLQAKRFHKSGSVSTIPFVLPLILSVHALIEGTALGVNVTLANIVIIFVAIIVHKGSESFALASSLGHSKLPYKQALTLFLGWAIMSPLGVLLGTLMANSVQTRQGQILAAIFNAFAAGTFLFIATLHRANKLCSSEHSNHFHEFLMLLLGLSLMAIVEVWL